MGTNIQVANTHVCELNNVIDEQLAAGHWKLHQAMSGIRSNYNAKRWQSMNMVQRFVGGVYMAKHAGLVSEAIMREEAGDGSSGSDDVLM